MPWFPDFIAAVELVRRQTSATARADTWPGDVVVYDPRAGERDAGIEGGR